MYYLIALIFVVVLCLIYFSFNKGSSKIGPPAKLMPSGKNLTVDEARNAALEIISKGERLVAVPRDGLEAGDEQLGPVVREFFSKFSSVRTPNGGVEISMSMVQPSIYISGFISIGHSEDWDIVVRSGMDEVFVVEGAELSEDDLEVSFPTVYHLLIDEAT